MTSFTSWNFILVFLIFRLFYDALSINDIILCSLRCGKMTGKVCVVANLMRCFSICLRRKTTGGLTRSGYPTRAIYKTQTVLTSRLVCGFLFILS
jgi:hypothetical protein